MEKVESAYIRISSNSDLIGTYSMNDVGDNIGLLIGCFYKVTKNTVYEWYFKPLHEVIPGKVVTNSISTIQNKLHLIFEKKAITSAELIERLKEIANSLSVYSQDQNYKYLYWNGEYWYTDSSNLIIGILNGRDVNNPKIGSYNEKFPVVKDVDANQLILLCNDTSTNFTKLESGVPRLLHFKDNQGNGHVGIYLGETISSSLGLHNVIEATTSWGANAVIYSWVDGDGTRRRYQRGTFSENNYKWTTHGSLNQWVY